MTQITASAPVRICDCGGWTDTWFAKTGCVFHIAVEPRVRVNVRVSARRPLQGATTIYAANYNECYPFTPSGKTWVKHPLLEAAIASVGVRTDLHIDVHVWSGVPPGAGMGTSAAVCVALVGALKDLSGASATPGEVAAAAHAVEADWLDQQSGVQDQLAAAYGGVNFIEIDDYPHATVRPVTLPPGVRDQLQDRLLVVYLGLSHSSTAIHEQVIRDVGGMGSSRPVLEELRQAARDAGDAVSAGDLDGLAAAMRANTEAQRRLHPSLIGAGAQAVIDAARGHGVIGWKVNGAGGEGGSLTLLFGPDQDRRAAFESALAAACPDARIIPVRLAAEGLRVVAPPSGV